MKVLFVPAVKEKVWKETDDASKKEYRRWVVRRKICGTPQESLDIIRV